MMINPSTLSRIEIKQAFRRNRGAAAKLARDLGVDRSNITAWMKNRGASSRVDLAIRQRAADLIQAERGATKQEGA